MSAFPLLILNVQTPGTLFYVEIQQRKLGAGSCFCGETAEGMERELGSRQEVVSEKGGCKEVGVKLFQGRETTEPESPAGSRREKIAVLYDFKE